MGLAKPNPDLQRQVDVTSETPEQFVDRLRGRLVGALVLYTGDLGKAEDIAQEAFVRAWQRWNALTHPEAWVYRVAFNLARSQVRRSKREARALEAIHAEPAARTEISSIDLTRSAVEQLPRRQREAIIFRFYLDLSVAESASVMGCAEGTVKATVHQALGSLRLALPQFSEAIDG